MSRARARRERGTPPGKFEDPLGDQLTWEQFLSRCSAADHVFIISRDTDYIERWNGELFLNPVLKADIRKVAPKAVVAEFDNLAKAIPELRRTIGAGVVVPPPEKLEKALKAEEQVAALDDALRTRRTYTPRADSAMNMWRDADSLIGGADVVKRLDSIMGGAGQGRTTAVSRPDPNPAQSDPDEKALDAADVQVPAHPEHDDDETANTRGYRRPIHCSAIAAVRSSSVNGRLHAAAIRSSSCLYAVRDVSRSR